MENKNKPQKFKGPSYQLSVWNRRPKASQDFPSKVNDKLLPSHIINNEKRGTMLSKPPWILEVTCGIRVYFLNPSMKVPVRLTEWGPEQKKGPEQV